MKSSNPRKQAKEFVRSAWPDRSYSRPRLVVVWLFSHFMPTTNNLSPEEQLIGIASWEEVVTQARKER